MIQDKIIEKYYIDGQDADWEVNLSDGYVSIWKNSYGNKVMVYSVQCPDTEKFYYDIIPYQTPGDIRMDYLEEIYDNPNRYKGFLQSMDISDHMLRDHSLKVKNEFDVITFLGDWQAYYGSPFNRLKSVESLSELLRKITKWNRKGNKENVRK